MVRPLRVGFGDPVLKRIRSCLRRTRVTPDDQPRRSMRTVEHEPNTVAPVDGSAGHPQPTAWGARGTGDHLAARRWRRSLPCLLVVEAEPPVAPSPQPEP